MAGIESSLVPGCDLAAPSVPVLAVHGHVATLTLNRPAHRNRLEEEDLRAMLAVFKQVNADTNIRVLTITSNTQGQPRPVFCAGYHIGGFDTQDHDPRLFENVADALAALRPVTICALNGSVYGGATDLLLACDLAIGLEGIEFRMPATLLGLHYYPGGLQRYVARLGVSAAKRAFLSARPFTASKLLDLGCLEELAAPHDFAMAVTRLANEVCGLAPLAVQATKQSLNELAAGHMDMQALRAREALAAGSRDFAEGRLAFLEKRKARFIGK